LIHSLCPIDTQNHKEPYTTFEQGCSCHENLEPFVLYEYLQALIPLKYFIIWKPVECESYYNLGLSMLQN